MDSTPRSMAASMVRRRARVPARWPAATGSRRRLAQRPFPSMMMATDRATSGSCRSRTGVRPLIVRSLESNRIVSVRARPALSDFHDLLFLLLQEVVDPGHVLVGELLRPVLGAPLLVVPDVAVPDELLEIVHDVAPDVADRHAPLLGQVFHDLDQLLAPLLRQLRDRQADQLAVVGRCQAELRLLDRPLNRLDRAGIVRLDREHAWLGHVDRRELLERSLLAVVIDLDSVEERGRGPAGPDGVELVRSRVDRLVHAALRVVEQLVDHGVLRGVEMMVPIRSPRATRSMLRSSSSPKTWIGRPLSMQSVSAVVSITLRPRSSASR